jgi:hypothetical protein
LPDSCPILGLGDVHDPALDDGVKVNITPLQEGEVLRYRKVV